MKKNVALMLSTILMSCSPAPHPEYESLKNDLPAGGMTIAFTSDVGFTNIEEIASHLSEEQADVFYQSLSWYGTEVLFGLSRLHGKTAGEAVDIVNCLKVSEPEHHEGCFD